MTVMGIFSDVILCITIPMVMVEARAIANIIPNVVYILLILFIFLLTHWYLLQRLLSAIL